MVSQNWGSEPVLRVTIEGSKCMVSLDCTDYGCAFLLVINCTRGYILHHSLRQIQNRCIWLPLLRLAVDGVFPWNDLHNILHGGQRMAKLRKGRNISENFNHLSRAHERYRRQTRQTDLRYQIHEQSRSGKHQLILDLTTPSVCRANFYPGSCH